MNFRHGGARVCGGLGAFCARTGLDPGAEAGARWHSAREAVLQRRVDPPRARPRAAPKSSARREPGRDSA